MRDFPLPSRERDRRGTRQGEGTWPASVPSPWLAGASRSLSRKGRGRKHWVWPALALLLCLLALLHPIDHDESQYVAAAVLTAHGLIPYRDYAYLQTPLQPFLLAPIAWAAGTVAWPALRFVNALFGALAIRCVYGAAREVADRRAAFTATALFACTDILLFSIGTARNDALPGACLAGAIWLAVRAERRGAGKAAALAAGLLLASAAAAKISYALPAAAYGAWALARPRHRPLSVAIGALPAMALVAWTYLLSPEGFVFGVFTFPAQAPLDWYADRPWKLSLAAKLLDTLKFLALGPAMLALAVTLFRRRLPAMLALLTLASLVAALLPTPTWRQYFLPMLPPLFVMLAHRWGQNPPGRAVRIAAVTFAVAGLAPTALALASGRPAMVAAMRQGAAIGRMMEAAGVHGEVITLSPQFLSATGRPLDPMFAAGPFVFRSRHLVSGSQNVGLNVLTRSVFDSMPAAPALLVGGEDRWTGGDPVLDALLERWALRRGMVRRDVPGTPFRLYVGFQPVIF